MKTQRQQHASYWDRVAVKISASHTAGPNLVGYQSLYDRHVREVAVTLLDQLMRIMPAPRRIAELGSGTGLNLRYMTRFSPEALFAFDCSANLLALAKEHLQDVPRVTYIQTDGAHIPVPEGVALDLLYTVTVLQHVTDAEMFASLTAAMRASGARWLLVLEDTRVPPSQPTADYVLRRPEDYQALGLGEYRLVTSMYVSLRWASYVLGAFNRICGLYRKHEGAALPGVVVRVGWVFRPLVRALDALFPGRFGMTGVLFERV